MMNNAGDTDGRLSRPTFFSARPFLGVQTKTSLLLLGLMSVVGVTAALCAVRQVRHLTTSVQATYAQEMARLVASLSEPLVANNDRSALALLCNEFVSTQHVRSVTFVASDGQTLAHAEDETATPQSPEPAFDVVTAEAPFLLVGDGDVAGPRGVVRLVCDASAAHAATAGIRQRLLWIALLASLAVVPLTVLIMRRVVRPLSEMAVVAGHFVEGDLSPRVLVRGADEIGTLGMAFNSMADRLSRSRQSLLQLNAKLERRIEERTRELQDLASRDPATNLYNRRHFAEVLAREFARAVRYGQDLTLMMVDLDNFKAVNDNHGHRAGDEVLLLTAETLRDELREADIAARYGGDEFIAMLPQTSGPEAEAVALRVIEAVRSRARRTMPGIPVDVSTGLASLRNTGAPSAEALQADVDKALYSVKRSVKGRIAHAPPRVRAKTSA